MSTHSTSLQTRVEHNQSPPTLAVRAGNKPQDQKDARLKTPLVTWTNLLRSTRPRQIMIAIVWGMYVVSAILLIVIPNVFFSNLQVHAASPTGKYTHLFQLDLSSVMPTTKKNAHLVNATLHEVGLSDFYRIGLWRFCKGSFATASMGSCSPPRFLFWFNPWEVVINEILVGSNLSMPDLVVTLLKVLRAASQAMFGSLLAAGIFHGLLLLVTPVVLFSRWWSLLVVIIAVLANMFILLGAILATGIPVIIEIGLGVQKEINVGVQMGIPMIALLWTTAILSIAASGLHIFMGLRMASFRDIRTNRCGRLNARNIPSQDNGSNAEKNAEMVAHTGMIRPRPDGPITSIVIMELESS